MIFPCDKCLAREAYSDGSCDCSVEVPLARGVPVVRYARPDIRGTVVGVFPASHTHPDPNPINAEGQTSDADRLSLARAIAEVRS